MLFVPLLVAVTALLLVPSPVLALTLGLGAWLYLGAAGRGVTKGKSRTIEGQLAYRILSVKLLRLNGEMTDNAFDCHAIMTPDDPENEQLRGLLRDAAASAGDGWKHYARVMKRVYGFDPSLLASRLEDIMIQLAAMPGAATAESQDRLIEIAKLWGIGPEKTRELAVTSHLRPSERMLAWK